MEPSVSRVQTPDGLMPLFRVSPNGQARGAVVVIQEAFGVTSHIQDIASRLAAEGWLAVAPALYYRQDSPVLDYNDLTQVMPIMQQLVADEITADLATVFSQLQAEGFSDARCGVLGFCMGGSIAFAAAAHLSLGACVSYYGGGITEGRFGFPPLLELAPKLRSPWLGHFGDLDKGIATDHVELLRDKCSQGEVDTMIYRYADADHGFNCNERPAVFNQSAATAAWERTLAWFGRHIPPISQ